MIKESKGYLGREVAETVAVQALSFLASDPESLGRFLSVTGLGPETLRQAAAQPSFLVAVLDHILADESLLLAFAANNGLRADAIPKARQILSDEAG